MNSKRVKASFLLQCVTLVTSLLIFILVLWLVTLGPMSLGVLIILAVFWFIGIEGGALPAYLERLAEKRAGASSKPVRSIWFVDLDSKKHEELSDFSKKTEDNPTLR